MELFLDNGHLTDDGLQAILNGSLDEMQNLEAAEHLSFCDDCLVRYTSLLAEDSLLAPSEPLRKPVLRRLHKKSAFILLKKAGTVAAAAALAVVLWSSGIFTLPLYAQHTSQPPAAPQKPDVSLSTRMNQAAGSFSEFLNGLWGARPDPQTPDKAQPESKAKPAPKP